MYGLGPLIAVRVNSMLAAAASKTEGSLNMAGYSFYWQWTAIIALVAMLAFAFFFKDETEQQSAPATSA